MMILIQTIAILFAKYAIYLLILGVGLWFLLGVPRSEKKRMIIFGAICLPIIFITSLIAARLYYDPRPFMVGHFTPLIAHSPGNGFPSDHTLLAAAIASTVWCFSRRVGTILFALTIIIGMSRVYLGIHHLVDIIGAIIIAVGVTYLIHVIANKKELHILDR